MKRPNLFSSSISFLAGCVSGCGTEFYARRLLSRSSIPGRARLAMLPAPEKLLAEGRIDERLGVVVDEGVELDVWVLRSRAGDATPRGTVLIIHGTWDSKARFFGLGERLAEAGFNVILPDLRAHGRSTGEHTTYGALEKHDMKKVVDAVAGAGRLVEPLYVFGVSMGGAIAVRYAAIDPRCRGVLSVAPYKDARAVVRRLVPLMSKAKYDAVWARAAEIAGFDPDDTSTTAAAARLACPLVVVHGRLDSLVPYAHGRAVYDAAPRPKEMITVPWAGHATILAAREKWFAERLAELADGTLPRKRTAADGPAGTP